MMFLCKSKQKNKFNIKIDELKVEIVQEITINLLII